MTGSYRMPTVHFPRLCQYLIQLLLRVCNYLHVSYTKWIRDLSILNIQRGERLAHKISPEKDSFLKKFGDDYGYPDGPTTIDELRSVDFARLQGIVYLDHAGATLYAENQLKAILNDLSSQVYGNPHSQSESSLLTTSIVEGARAQVLGMCNASAEEYNCVFTSGATAALKLVGETFPWTGDSHYMYTIENHNSVLGIREYALDHGATVTPVDIVYPSSKLSGETIAGNFGTNTVKKRTSQKRKDIVLSSDKHLDGQSSYNLFALPQECNFSGARHDLELVSFVQQGRHVDSDRGRWLVLLDAAKGCGSNPPDLHRFPADFVAISFYKIFGYPSGLGALLVRKGASKLMKKTYFGGGTVAVSIADADFIKRRLKVEERLEDGTASFLSIASLRHGFDYINRLQMAAISRHSRSLTSYTVSKLASLRHNNGNMVCTIYGNHLHDTKHESYSLRQCDQGPIVAFNLRRADGSWVGCREVEKLASLRGIHLRTGCFCNPGACAKYLGLSTNDMKENFEAGHVCWDDNDLVNGRPTGAVRVSFGYMSTFEDCWVFLNFISNFFIDRHATVPRGRKEKDAGCINKRVSTNSDDSPTVFLQSIIVYPIKSCAGFSANIWPLGDAGLLYDREWLIKSTAGEVLTQKKYPLMWSITTHIDLESGFLLVKAPTMEDGIQIPLRSVADPSGSVPLCGNSAGSSKCGSDADRWFSQALNTPCKLVRREAKSRYGRARGSVIAGADSNVIEEEGKELSFANEGQFLLVSESSVENLNVRLSKTISQSPDIELRGVASSGKQRFQVDVRRFRPNLVVAGSKSYDEDEWDIIAIGDQQFKVRGGCNRCSMVNIDQTTGERQARSEPLATLASYRRFKGRINFGILLEQERQAMPGDYLGESEKTVEDFDHLSDSFVQRSYDRVLQVKQRVRVAQSSTCIYKEYRADTGIISL